MEQKRKRGLGPVGWSRVLSVLACVLTGCFIFLNSADTGTLSGEKSSWVLQWLNGLLAGSGLQWELSEFFVRKLGHFLEYALLGSLLLYSLSTFTRWLGRYFAWPLLLGLATAVGDELFQTFVPGRSGMVQDVALDFSGVVFGACLCAGTLWLVRCRRQRKAEKGAPHMVES